MAMNRVQFQRGLSMPEFMDRYGSQDKCEAAVMVSRWPGGFCLSRMCRTCAHVVPPGRPPVLAMCQLQPSVQPHQWHPIRRQQAASDPLVLGNALAHAGQEQRGCTVSSNGTWAFATELPGWSSTS